MVLVTAKNFKSLSFDVLKSLHEGVRNLGMLLFLDNTESLEAFKAKGKHIIFFSYQWLSWDSPGPNVVQLECMRASIEKLCHERSMQEEDTLIWLDILSIPQCCNNIKSLAVNSLYTYARQSDLLAIIAPESVHANTGKPGNAKSYQTRAWCRAEQTAFFCLNGASNMYLMTAADFGRVPNGWIQDATKVFDGDMTCCLLNHAGGLPCDRESLVPALLGLYFDLYTKRQSNSLDEHAKTVWQVIERDKELVFPREYDYVTKKGVQKRELFGGMIDRVERYVNNNLQSAVEQSTSRSVEVSGQHALAHNNSIIIVPDAAPRDMYTVGEI